MLGNCERDQCSSVLPYGSILFYLPRQSNHLDCLFPEKVWLKVTQPNNSANLLLPSQLSPYGSGPASYPRTNNTVTINWKFSMAKHLYLQKKHSLVTAITFLSIFTHLTHKSDIKIGFLEDYSPLNLILGTFSSDDEYVNVNYRKLENEPWCYHACPNEHELVVHTSLRTPFAAIWRPVVNVSIAWLIFFYFLT